MSTDTLEVTTSMELDLSEFVNGLKSVRPFASTDRTLPLLTYVKVATDEHGTLTLITTDRYTAATYRVAHTGDTLDRCLPPVAVKTLVDVLTPLARAHRRDASTVTLAVTGDSLAVRHYGQAIVTVPLVTPSESESYPQILRLIPEYSADSQGTARIAFDAAMLARFAKVVGDREPMRMSLAPSNKPVRVDIGDCFTGLIMPVRIA